MNTGLRDLILYQEMKRVFQIINCSVEIDYQKLGPFKFMSPIYVDAAPGS